MKRKTNPAKMLLQLTACIIALAVAMPGYALTQKNPSMSVEQMTKDADEIIIGSVVGQNTRVVANSFETDYQIQVNENLKSKSGRFSAGQTVTLTVPGGALQEPPLSQYVMGTPYMYKGEEVFLFLKAGSGKEVRLPRSREAAGEVSKLTTTHKVIGLNQGRFDVLTLKDTGEKVVTRMNLENYGLINDSEAIRHAIQAIADRQIPTMMQQIARQEDKAAEAREKDPLEFTGTDGKQIKVEQNMQKAQSMKELRQRKPVVQKFEEFKAQVKAFANSY